MAEHNRHPIRYTVEHHRRDGVSEEAFTHWLTKVHIPLALPVMKRHKIVKFAVHRADLKIGAAFQAKMAEVQPGWKVSDADVVLEYWTYDMANIKGLASDPEWTEGAAKDEDVWLDISKSNIHIGYHTTYLEDGGLINTEQK